MAETKACEDAGENLDHDGQSVALVALGASQRQHRPAVLQIGGVCRWVAILVDDPALGDRLSPGHGHAQFARCYSAGGHVDEHRPFQVAGHADADGVCAQPGLPASEWHNAFGGSAGVGRHHAYQAFLGRHDRVVGHTPHVALPENGGGRDTVLQGLLDCGLHSPLGHHISVSPVPVHDSRGRGLPGDFVLCAGHDMASLHAVDIGGNLDNAVGVVARQVCANGMAGYYGCLLLACAGPHQELRCDFF